MRIIGVISFIIGVILIGLGLSMVVINYINSTEISPQMYGAIYKVKDEPIVKDHITEAMTDGKITHKEYSDIISKAEQYIETQVKKELENR